MKSKHIFSTKKQAYTFTKSLNISSKSVQIPLYSNPFGKNCQKRSFSATQHPFDTTPQWDVISATKEITHLAKQSKNEESLNFFKTVFRTNIMPNQFTFGALIPSAICLKDLYLGKQIHSLAKKIGIFSNVYVGSALLNLYSKLSTVEEAHMVFEETYQPNVVSYTTLVCLYLKRERFSEGFELFESMPERNVVTWNGVIGGLGQTGRNEEAVEFFIRMLRAGYLPNRYTFSRVISSVSNIAVLGMGRSFHASAIKFLSSNLDMFVSNSLISFYAKCGNLDDSRLIFDNLLEKSVVSWNALICGYAQNGRGIEALDLFREMKCTGVEPNSVTLLGVLLACNYIGLVKEGYMYFNETRCKDPRLLKPEHYACMIDSLSRFGLFKEAKTFINDLPFDNLGIGFWKALLGGCQIHNNVELGKLAARKILALDPGDVSSYVMLSNAHAAAGRWEDASMARQEMRERGMKSIPGCSWIEIKNCVSVFTNADTRHSKKDEIYMVLGCFLEDVAEKKGLELLNEPNIQLHNQSS